MTRDVSARRICFLGSIREEQPIAFALVVSFVVIVAAVFGKHT
jgi:hypothetical protein